MALLRQFAQYPGAKEATNISYNFQEGSNPNMRGIPLYLGAAV